MSTYTRTGGALLAAATALALAALPASAPAQTGQIAFARSVGAMHYTSTDAATTIRVSLSNNTFTIDDEVPIQAQQGCAAVAGDATKVTCTAFKDSQPSFFKPFTVSAGGGADTVENNTTKTNGVGAAMLAAGGDGNDTLVGADKVADRLHGGNAQDEIRGGNGTFGASDELFGDGGNDTLIGGDSADNLVGGTGNDTLDGSDGGDRLNGGSGDDKIDGGKVDTLGPSGHDLVSYASSSQPVIVDLHRVSPQGETGENDQILNVEDIEGSPEGDQLIGNDNANGLFGLEGDDTLAGDKGIDSLSGGDGDDVLLPSPDGFFTVFSDGVFDSMDCGEFGRSDGDPGDLAFRVLADGDLVSDCAVVIDK